jgi:hypothetical protein
MRPFTFLLLLIIITSCNNSGGVRMPMPQNPDINKGFHPFLKEGSYKVEYYLNKEVTAGQKQLLRKLSKLIETNKQTQKYFRQIEEGGKPAYSSDIGISKQEFNLLIELFSYKEPEKLDGTLKIIRDGNSYKFQGQERLSLLDSLTISINSKSASFKQYSMSLVKDSIDLSGEDIPKNDTIEFYEYYKSPDGILGLTGLDGIYELLVAKLKPSNKTYLSFFARKPDNIEHPIPKFINVIIEK